ncbi:MAG: iron ABC transporter substrate-binding protein [Dehalococcoidia bacterium]|nr:iron ABC transporter substrate-binding protein [Dehalococcoidia bacterium]
MHLRMTGVPMHRLRILSLTTAAAALAVMAAACGGDDDDGGSITVYSGRSEALVAPIIEDFTEETGIKVNVKYAGTDAAAALLLEEGGKSPADVFFSQDGGALGAVREAGLLATLPGSITGLVPEQYRASDGSWVGISGRSRVVVYNPGLINASDLPASYKDLTSAKWKGKVGWAPANASFQAFITAVRKVDGEDAAKAWLEAMAKNDAKTYANNNAIVSAVASGEISLGVVNHYYLWGLIKDQGEINAKNHYLAAGDPGALVNVAGAAVLKSAPNKSGAEKFVEYLLQKHAQEFFAQETFEYPLANGIATDPRIKPLAELKPPAIDLSDLDDLAGTLALLRSTGVLK